MQIPESMTTLQVIAVQNLAGRKHDHVRVFGYREHDPDMKIMEVALRPSDAVELLEDANRDKSFPQIEIPSKALIGILNTAGIDVIHLSTGGGDPNSPNLFPRRGA